MLERATAGVLAMQKCPMSEYKVLVVHVRRNVMLGNKDSGVERKDDGGCVVGEEEERGGRVAWGVYAV